MVECNRVKQIESRPVELSRAVVECLASIRLRRLSTKLMQISTDLDMQLLYRLRVTQIERIDHNGTTFNARVQLVG